MAELALAVPESHIATLVSRNLIHLKALAAALENDQIKRAVVASHASRFRLWAGSLGAHRISGSRSLDYRLRDASHVKKHVLSLLQDLGDSINEGLSSVDETSETMVPVAEDKDPTLHELAEYFQDDEGAENKHIDKVLSDIGHVIDCLLRLSLTIRNPAPHDQFKSRAGAGLIEHYKEWDLRHIQEKFPALDQGISERLARATANRRHYFKYREEHASKLAEGLNDLEDEEEQLAKSIKATTLASSLPNHLKETPNEEKPLIEDNMSEVSGTSYATSLASADQSQMPPMPITHEDGLCKCPFCHMIILVQNRRDWKRHVFRDLQPYICLEKDCTTADNLFHRRSYWVQHMKAKHWRVWHCLFGCSGTFHSRKEMQDHIQSNHKQDVSKINFGSLEDLSSESDVGKSHGMCHFCEDFHCGSEQQYERHVGRHLEDLALFALPTTGDNAHDQASDDNGEDRTSQETASETSLTPKSDVVPELEGARLLQICDKLESQIQNVKQELEGSSVSDDFSQRLHILGREVSSTRVSLKTCLADTASVSSRQLDFRIHESAINLLESQLQGLLLERRLQRLVREIGLQDGSASQIGEENPRVPTSPEVIDTLSFDQLRSEISRMRASLRPDDAAASMSDYSDQAPQPGTENSVKILSESMQTDREKSKIETVDMKVQSPMRQEEETKTWKPPIKFRDAVGRKFTFPFHLCAKWQGMEELINQAFLQVDTLRPHVQEGHYDLIGPNGEAILPSVWEKVIEPDWQITMDMWPMDKASPMARGMEDGRRAIPATALRAQAKVSQTIPSPDGQGCERHVS